MIYYSKSLVFVFRNYLSGKSATWVCLHESLAAYYKFNLQTRNTDSMLPWIAKYRTAEIRSSQLMKTEVLVRIRQFTETTGLQRGLLRNNCRRYERWVSNGDERPLIVRGDKRVFVVPLFAPETNVQKGALPELRGGRKRHRFVCCASNTLRVHEYSAPVQGLVIISWLHST